MEVKYEPIFGDQSSFDGAPEDAEAVGGGKPLQDALVFYKFSDREFQYKYAAEIDDWKVSTCKHPQSVIKAMRRIIKTPVWTQDDKDAGRLPEVGCKCVGILSEAIKRVVHVNKHIVAVENEKTLNVCNFTHEEFFRNHKPIETPAEKAARLKSEWCAKAAKQLKNLEYTSTLTSIYDALLSGELKTPEVE